MMACAPSLMNQERKYLELLGQVVDGHIGRQGELLLETGNGEVIKAFPATTDNL
jgi:heat shock protein HslJ